MVRFIITLLNVCALSFCLTSCKCNNDGGATGGNACECDGIVFPADIPAFQMERLQDEKKMLELSGDTLDAHFIHRFVEVYYGGLYPERQRENAVKDLAKRFQSNSVFLLAGKVEVWDDIQAYVIVRKCIKESKPLDDMVTYLGQKQEAFVYLVTVRDSQIQSVDIIAFASNDNTLNPSLFCKRNTDNTFAVYNDADSTCVTVDKDGMISSETLRGYECEFNDVE